MPPSLFYSTLNSYNSSIPVVNEKQQNTDIHAQLIGCVDFDSHVKEPIIETLPKTLVEDIKQHLAEDALRMKKYTGRELSPEDYEDRAAGYLFELLNYSEWVTKQFRGKREGTPEWEAAEDIVTISNTLCKIARYPQEYGIDIDIRSRIPDGVYVGMTKEGDFSIYGLAEAKLGAIDERALEQLRYSGSRTTMATIVEKVDTILSTTPEEELPEDLLELKNVLKGRHLKVRWDEERGKKHPRMSLDLLIPTRGGSSALFEQHVTYKSSNIEGLYMNLEKNERVAPKNSPFSASEVHNMTKRILAEIEF